MIDPAKPAYANTPVSPQRPWFGYAPSDPAVPPCVTIVTPFYNTGPVFHETARSVLRQSLQQWEWLIVNDGSTDPEALALLEGYRLSDSRVRVIDHNVNRGLSTARNTGFRAARTPYVVQLDSDDLLEPTAVEKWVWCLESYPEFAFVKGYTVGFEAQEYVWQGGFHNGSTFLEENMVAPTSAVRAAVHHAVGGYDETIRGGLEDWDFWLRCANSDYWGGTVPEYLDWYRRRPAHNDRWTNWDKAERQRAFHAQLHQRYPRLWRGGFPRIPIRTDLPFDPLPEALPWQNRLRRDKPRLLLILSELALEGTGEANLAVVEQLTREGWEVSAVATRKGDHAGLPHFARYTPDVFILPHFLRLVDYPRFLRYLMSSRQVDVVLLAHSEFGYLVLPDLRAHCPEVTIVGLCHDESKTGKKGNAQRMVVDYQELLDLQIVSAEHLKDWLVAQHADPQRIRVFQGNSAPHKECSTLEQPTTGRQGLDPQSEASGALMGVRMIALLQEAMRVHVTEPRPVPSLALGRVCAVQAVESTRLSEGAGELWRERGQISLQPYLLDPGSDSWRTLAYFALRRLLLPYYQAALVRGMKWLLPLKDKLKRALSGQKAVSGS